MQHRPSIMISPDRQVSPAPGIRRWLPAAALLILIGTAYLAGLDSYLSLRSIAEHRELLKDFAANHLVFALLLYVAIYIGVVGLSLPGAAFLSVVGGFLFGWWLSAPVTVGAATVGAVIVFEIVKSSIGKTVAERAGPTARKLSEGFARDAFNYLLFLRLVPAIPFFVVNAVAGISGVALRTFAAATVIGIIPGSIAFAYLGTGLDSIIDAQTDIYQKCIAEKGIANCELKLDASALVTSDIVIALLALAAVALIPVAFKLWKSKSRRSGEV